MFELDDKTELAAFFERDRGLHLYELGDLDPFFWPDTRWFGWRDGGELVAVALLFTGARVPTVVLLERRHPKEAAALLRTLAPQLPSRFYAHLSPGLDRFLEGASLSRAGRHLKMVLDAVEPVMAQATGGVERLGPADTDEVSRFYAESYPGNWFTPRMLETGHYVGARAAGTLVAVAGVHVYSPEYQVAALGNIATSPTHRGHGLGRRVTARLCQSLLEHVATIGLNVRADNEPAIRCYRRLGFEVIAEYDEIMVERLPA